MPTVQIKKWILTSHPDGEFSAERHAKLVEESVDLDLVTFSGKDSALPENKESGLLLEPNDVVVSVEALSVDAFIRTMLDRDAFHGSVQPESALPAVGYGTVLKAGPDAKFKEGARVLGLMSASTVSVVKSENLSTMMSFPGVKPSACLGCLGVSGITAFIGLFSAPTCAPRKKETVVVSAAAGGCGNVAAQLAKLCGARVVGIAGGPAKKKFLLEQLGLDGAVDYKHPDKSLEEQLQEQCPNGIDFYFDNVGGDVLDAVLEKINTNARISICGAVSQYSNNNVNKKGAVQGPTNYIKLAEKNASMTGFTIMGHPLGMAKAVPYLLWHYYRGNVKSHEHFVDGIENFASAIEALFSGGHCGRLLVDVDGKQK